MSFPHWQDADLASFLRMHGKNPGNYRGHDELAAKAEKKHRDNPSILPRWIQQNDPSFLAQQQPARASNNYGHAPTYPAGPPQQAQAYPPNSPAYHTNTPAYPAYPAPAYSAPQHVPPGGGHQSYPPMNQGVGNPQMGIYGQPGPGQGPPKPPPPARANVSERRRKALLVGCNYPGTANELRGCVNDALCMEHFLKTQFGFESKNIRVLRDDVQGGRAAGIMPTHHNILGNIHWLVGDARAGDSLFFHFSGHGSQKRDPTGDEADGMNETILPTDFKTCGQIVDDALNKALVRPICQGCVLHCVIDACHSGTALDLPFFTRQVSPGRMEWRQEGRTRVYKGTSGGLAVQFGACKDDQTAADTSALSSDRVSTGAASFLFIQAFIHLSENGQRNVTYAQVIADMLKQIGAVNGPSGGSGGSMGGGIFGKVAAGVFAAATGGGAGGVLNQMLGGGGRTRGQTPQLSASEAIDLGSAMII